MSKRKHVWHCGKCHEPVHVLKKSKGTKYLYCPHHGLVGYYNFDILGAISKVGKGLVKSIPVVGGLAAEFWPEPDVGHPIPTPREIPLQRERPPVQVIKQYSYPVKTRKQKMTEIDEMLRK